MKNSTIFPVVLVLFITIFFWSCFCKKGEGKIKTETRNITDFNELVLDGQAQIYIRQDTFISLKVVTDSNLVENIKTEVSGEKLKIYDSRCLKNVTEYKIYLTFKEISVIKIEGAVKLKCDSAIKSENLYISDKSAGEVDLRLDTDNLEVETGGSGLLKLSGRALDFDLDVDEAGSVDAYTLQAKNVDANIYGAGSCKINVSEKLNGNIEGSGKIIYKGNPKKVNADISGTGKMVAN
jgi:hypothetical protein